MTTDLIIVIKILLIAFSFIAIVQMLWLLHMYYEFKINKGELYGKKFLTFKEYLTYYRKNIRPW